MQSGGYCEPDSVHGTGYQGHLPFQREPRHGELCHDDLLITDCCVRGNYVAYVAFADVKAEQHHRWNGFKISGNEFCDKKVAGAFNLVFPTLRVEIPRETAGLKKQ